MPSSPEPTATESAYALVDAWAAHHRAKAQRDASPAAVATLFSYKYPGSFDFRSCSTPPDDTVPSYCVARVGNNLLSLTVRFFKHGWGVTAAAMET